MNNRPTLGSSDQEIIDFVSSWIDHLVKFGYDSAISLLDDPTEPNRRKWTSEEWGKELQIYGDHAALTTPREVTDLRKNVYRYTDGSGYAVDYDLPVNGKRSDHTLQFDFKFTGKSVSVALYDLHIL